MGLQLLKDREWSLTWEARAALLKLTTNWKLDEDLALSLLERIWPEAAIYELPGAQIQLCRPDESDPYGLD